LVGKLVVKLAAVVVGVDRFPWNNGKATTVLEHHKKHVVIIIGINLLDEHLDVLLRKL
jgi:hypothetical protein